MILTVYLCLIAGAQGWALYRHLFVLHTPWAKAVWLLPIFAAAVTGLIVVATLSALGGFSPLANLLLIVGASAVAVMFFSLHILAPGRMGGETEELYEADDLARRKAESRRYGYHPTLLAGTDQE